MVSHMEGDELSIIVSILQMRKRKRAGTGTKAVRVNNRWGAGKRGLKPETGDTSGHS